MCTGEESTVMDRWPGDERFDKIHISWDMDAIDCLHMWVESRITDEDANANAQRLGDHQ
jgi:hypothetical protein